MIDTELVEFEGWTLRVRAAVHPERLLLLIHGHTGDENSMWVFARDLPATYQMIAPRAMHPSGSTGYSWRPNAGSDIGMPSLDQLRPAAEALIRLVDQYQASAGIEAEQFDVMGFSQGAVMSNILAFLNPQRVRKVGILAGFLPQGIEKMISSRPVEGKPYFVTHGTKDATVAIERARDSVTMLERAGANVTYCEDEVGHKVSINCLLALKRFFGE